MPPATPVPVTLAELNPPEPSTPVTVTVASLAVVEPPKFVPTIVIIFPTL